MLLGSRRRLPEPRSFISNTVPHCHDSLLSRTRIESQETSEKLDGETDLRSFAWKTRSTLQEHLETAQDIQAKMRRGGHCLHFLVSSRSGRLDKGSDSSHIGVKRLNHQIIVPGMGDEE